MNRLKQYWKVVAYLVGLVLLAGLVSEFVTGLYMLAGIAYGVLQLAKRGGNTKGFDQTLDDFDEIQNDPVCNPYYGHLNYNRYFSETSTG